MRVELKKGKKQFGPKIALNLFEEHTKMPLINIVVTLIVIGIALWLINNFIPMASSIKSILNILVIVVVCVWLLQVAGVWGTVTNFRLTRSGV